MPISHLDGEGSGEQHSPARVCCKQGCEMRALHAQDPAPHLLFDDTPGKHPLAWMALGGEALHEFHPTLACEFPHQVHTVPIILDAGAELLNMLQEAVLIFRQPCGVGERAGEGPGEDIRKPARGPCLLFTTPWWKNTEDSHVLRTGTIDPELLKSSISVEHTCLSLPEAPRGSQQPGQGRGGLWPPAAGTPPKLCWQALGLAFRGSMS